MSRPLLYKATGIIIRRYNVGESDRVIIALCKEYGKKKLIAKGIRKITSRRASHLELFSKTAFVLHKGSAYEYVSQASALVPYGASISDLSKMAAVYCICEAIDRLLPYGQPFDDVYLTLEQMLVDIQSTTGKEDIARSIIMYIDLILSELGYQQATVRHKNVGAAIAKVEEVIERKIKSSALLAKSGIELFPN